MSFYKGKNVLVTGAAGLAGREIVRQLLNEGSNVYALNGFRRKIKLNEYDGVQIYEPHEEGLFNYEYCEEMTKNKDIVIHAAAYIRGAKGQEENPLALVRNNTIPTLNIMEAAVKNKVQNFGFIGSSTMYPDSPEPMTEDRGFEGDPPRCYEGVGWFKRYCEKMAMYLHRITDTNFCIVRTTALYGPYDNFIPGEGHVIPSLIWKIHNANNDGVVNRIEIWGDGSQIRNFCYVEDFVEGFLKAIHKYSIADPINIADPIDVAIKELAENIKSIFILKFSDKSYIQKYDISKPTMIPIRRVDINKAKNILGWYPKTSLFDGLKKTIEYFLSEIAPNYE